MTIAQLTIEGDPLARTVIDGGTLTTILRVVAPSASIRNLTLQNGSPAITFEGSGQLSGQGLTITGSNPGVSSDSGGTIALTNSTIANNVGNGIEISCSTLRLTNVTVSDNEVGVSDQ